MNIQHPLLFLALALLSLSPGISHACEMGETEKARLFSKFDKNGDGFLSRDEYVYSEMRRLGKTGATVMKDMDRRFRELARDGEIAPETFEPVPLGRCKE